MISAILCDVEGTTTDLAFVHQTLSPYARRHIANFLRQQQSQPAVKSALLSLRTEAQLPLAGLDRLIAELLHYIDIDKPSPALKQLQAMIWAEGYISGQFTGHIYEDAYEQIKRWHNAGQAVYLYSSSTIAAQELLFGHSDHGNVLPLINGHFDSSVGSKRDSSSYRSIRETLGIPAEQLLYVSATHQELDAARQDGWHTVQISRQAPDRRSTHTQVTSFLDIPAVQ